MANKINKDDPRTFLYLGGGLKKELTKYAGTDPRFDSISACGAHLIRLGMDADKQSRAESIKSIS